jgi:hypothetical protein
VAGDAPDKDHVDLSEIQGSRSYPRLGTSIKAGRPFNTGPSFHFVHNMVADTLFGFDEQFPSN